MKAVFATVTGATLLFCCIATAQEVNCSLVANGKSAVLKYAVAQEVDSALEKGYMDVIVVLRTANSDADARDIERLEAMTRNDGLVALVVRLNPTQRSWRRRCTQRSRPLYRPPPSFGGANRIRREAGGRAFLDRWHAERVSPALELRRYVFDGDYAGSSGEDGTEELVAACMGPVKRRSWFLAAAVLALVSAAVLTGSTRRRPFHPLSVIPSPTS